MATGVGGSEPRLFREGSLPSEVLVKKNGYNTPPNAPALDVSDLCGGGVEAAGGVSTSSGEAVAGGVGDIARGASFLGLKLK